MISSFNAEIKIFAGKNTKAIFESIKTDNKFYDENPTKTRILMNREIIIKIEPQDIPHLRANLNSTLRLIQASNESLESVKI